MVETGQARYVARHYAFLSPQSTRAAEASECAAEQEKFWEYRDQVFENQGQLRASDDWILLKSLATKVGLDQTRFNACVDSGRYTRLVRDEVSEAERLGVPGTPAIYVNGAQVKPAAGGLPAVEDIKQEVEKARAAKGQ